MRDKIFRTVTQYNLLICGDIVLCALSGGPDSMALLHVLRSLAGECGIKLCAAHFNHHIRPEADSDESFVREHCASLGIAVYCGGADVPSAARERGQTLEQAARELRYDFLDIAASACNANRIALGHHMDDQAETLLLNIGRGSGLRGARGMLPANGAYIRPLLFARKTEILEYVQANGIPFCVDATNADTRFTRNHARATVGELSAAMPGFVPACSRFALLAGEDESYLESVAARELDRLLPEGLPAEEGIDHAALLALHPAIAGRVMRQYAARAGLACDLEHVHVAALLALHGTGKQVNLPHGYSGRLSYGALIIERQSETRDWEALPLAVPGKTHTPVGSISAAPVGSLADASAGCFFRVYAPANLQACPLSGLPIVVRPRRDGDYIEQFGGGTKKLKKIFIDKKIDRAQRVLPVVAAGSEVLWAVGAAVSEKLRVQPGQDAIELLFTQKP